MITFWILATLLVVIALAFLLPRLLRGQRAGHRELGFSAAQARKQLKSLDQAHAHGHIGEADYQKRREEISSGLLGDLDDDDGSEPGSVAPITARRSGRPWIMMSPPGDTPARAARATSCALG